MAEKQHFVRALGLFDSTMIVAGSMIGSGIFIVSADISRQVGSPGWLLLVWLLTGVLTLAAALSYGELAGMMPHAGGQYVYLREAFSPMWAFLYGWTLFLVIQTGTIAAVAVAFARFTGVLVPRWIGEEVFLFNFGNWQGFSLSLSTAQLLAILTVSFLTALNTRGVRQGKVVQNVFTVTKTGALIGVVVLGIAFGSPSEGAFSQTDFWTAYAEDGSKLFGLALLMAVGTAMVGSLFSADAWNNITFTAGEVKEPRRNIPLSMAFGTGLVITLYFMANVAYLSILPLEGIQQAPADRLGTAAMRIIFGPNASVIMAVTIMISTFGAANGLILAGARVYYAMARDGLFFQRVGVLNSHSVPAAALVLQAIWTCILILPRTYDPATGRYGNVYSNLLDYVIFAVMLFYVLTVTGLFVLRRKKPDVERPYRAFGYPLVPALYVVLAALITLDLLVAEKTQRNAIPGLILVLTGLPTYWVWKRR